MKKQKQDKLFMLRCYCDTCGKLLMESIPMTKKELMSSYDAAVINAPACPCEDCGNHVPNFKITLKIYNRGTNKEYLPKDILPDPRNNPLLHM